MTARHGVFVAPFDELSDPALVADLAARAESRGWDGFFVWDHVQYRAPVRAVADPWVTLAAVAVATERLTIGPLVTPLARRRAHKLARETVTLDRLSGGRLVLGVGLGGDRNGEFEPTPLQRPRIPVWVAGRWPNRRPLRRAARWDGLFPIDLDGPETLVEIAAEIRALRGPDAAPDFDLVVTNPAGTDPAPWIAAGATWCLTGFGPQPTRAEVERAIDSR